MKTTPIGAPRGTQGPRRRSQAGARHSGFSDLLGAPTPSSGAAPSSSATGIGIDALLGLQEVGEEPSRRNRQRAMGRGNDILDRLDALRLDILAGRVAPASLEQLAQVLRQKRESVTDDALASVLDEVHLRAEVELAKLARAT